MELVVRKNDLLRELQLFQGIVERKNTIPILANVLLEANGNEVRLLATDLEVALRSRCEAAGRLSGIPHSGCQTPKALHLPYGDLWDRSESEALPIDGSD